MMILIALLVDFMVLETAMTLGKSISPDLTLRWQPGKPRYHKLSLDSWMIKSKSIIIFVLSLYIYILYIYMVYEFHL